MSLRRWQKEALAFPYSDPDLCKRIHDEFLAQPKATRKARTDFGKARAPYGKRDRPNRDQVVATPSGYVTTGARAEAMKSAYLNGKTLKEIGQEYGLTRERVRQILAKRFNVSKNDGGGAIKTFLRTPDRVTKSKLRNEAQQQKDFARYGCSKELIKSLSEQPLSHPSQPVLKYRYQVKNAASRGIAWELTFKEWWDIWQESGHWGERGRGKGYCMARFGDTGPYSKDNVEIITISQNFKDSYITKPWAARFPNGKRSKSNYAEFRPAIPKNGNRPRWNVYFRGKFITSFNIAGA